jgi:hypothetical protein
MTLKVNGVGKAIILINKYEPFEFIEPVSASLQEGKPLEIFEPLHKKNRSRQD